MHATRRPSDLFLQCRSLESCLIISYSAADCVRTYLYAVSARGKNRSGSSCVSVQKLLCAPQRKREVRQNMSSGKPGNHIERKPACLAIYELVKKEEERYRKTKRAGTDRKKGEKGKERQMQ